MRVDVVASLDAATHVLAFRFQFALHRRLLQREFLVLWHARAVTGTTAASATSSTTPALSSARAAPAEASILIVARSISHPACPVSPWQPRGRVFAGGWLLQPVAGRRRRGSDHDTTDAADGNGDTQDDGNDDEVERRTGGVRVTHAVHADIGDSSLPAWVLQAAIAQHPLLLRRLAASFQA